MERTSNLLTMRREPFATPLNRHEISWFSQTDLEPHLEDFLRRNCLHRSCGAVFFHHGQARTYFSFFKNGFLTKPFLRSRLQSHKAIGQPLGAYPKMLFSRFVPSARSGI